MTDKTVASPRRTKIIATLGPATDSEEVIEQAIDAGVDAVRMNFSHGTPQDHINRANIVRQVTKKKRRYIAILGDLQGPKIRIQKFKGSEVVLEEGQTFTLDASLAEHDGNQERVGITYPDLYKDIKTGDDLVLDDGRIKLKTEKCEDGKVVTTVVTGGVLSDNKGVNRSGGGLSAPSITEKDKEDMKLAKEIGVDYLAISFVKSAADVNYAKKKLQEIDFDPQIIAKIERTEALENIDEIIEVSNGIMVARGDLSNEIGDATLTAVQKSLINKARTHRRIVITATEMLQSMIDSKVPTRAEISDVANAALDGSDALMLSAESAVGSYPIDAIETMHRLCCGAEQAETDFYNPGDLFPPTMDRVDQTIALSAIYAASHFKVNAIAALTESGSTPLYMSRFRSQIPIYAITPHISTCCKVTLYRSVYPVLLRDEDRLESATDEAIQKLVRRKAVKSGDQLILTKGDKIGILGGTNGMKVVQVP